MSACFRQIAVPYALVLPLFIGLVVTWTGSPAAASEATSATQPTAAAFETILFPSEDGLEITADLYRAHDDPETPFIVLFHQAGWSRGEYREIAPKLVARGFNCLAIDQRSGGEVNGVVNRTHERAIAAELDTAYLDAIPDLRAAVAFARKHHARGKLVAWGSSYSAALVLRLGGEEASFADGIAAFAPGEYFERFGRSATWVRDSARRLNGPVFITSAREEYPNWKDIFEVIPSDSKIRFVPETEGNHGSRALWEQFEDHEAYWGAVERFLKFWARP